MEPKAPYLRAKLAFLTDTRAISAAETLLSLVEHFEVAPIVGSPTAGTNGNVRVISLPGGFEMRFTGIKVVNYDGSPFHTHGVPITVPVTRTIKGAAEERDEVLERAVQHVSG